MGFSGYCLCQQRLTGSRRSYQKGALGKLCSDCRIFSRIVKEIHNLLEGLFGFVLSCHILKGDSGFLLYVCLCPALAYASHHAAALIHAAEQKA